MKKIIQTQRKHCPTLLITMLFWKKVFCKRLVNSAREHAMTAINWSITVVQNFALNSLNLGLLDKKVYKAMHRVKLGKIIEK